MSAHQFFIKQLEFGIKHLPPTIPEKEQEEIRTLFGGLQALEEKVTAKDIEETMIKIGRIEWPYRHAYESLVDVCCSHTQHDLFLEALSPKTKKKFLDIGGGDATVQEVVHSKLFEEKLSPEERYEVQEAALEARLKMFDYMENMVKQRQEEYEKLLAESFAQQKEIQAAIDRLGELESIDQHWGPDIRGKVEQFQLGWSVAEPDVSLADVEKEIEYWQGMLHANGVEQEESFLS